MGPSANLMGAGVARTLTITRDAVATARELSPRAWVLMGAAFLCLVLALFAPDRTAQLAAVVAGVTFSALVLVIRGLVAAAGLAERLAEARLGTLVGQDATPCFTTNDLGQIGFQNQAARDRFRADGGATLVATLGDHFASPASVLFRLQSRAANLGAAREDVVTRRGHMRLSVHRIAPRRFLWRVEEFADRGASGRGAESLSLPMLVANKAGVVLFSNEAMRRLVGQRPKRLDRVFLSPVLRPGEEVQVAGVDGPVRAYLAEIEGPGERREIYLLPVADRIEHGRVLTDFEAVPVALARFRPDGGLLAANRAAREMLGLGAGDHARFQDLFEGLGRSLTDWLDDVASERLPQAAEVLRLRRGGAEAFLQIVLRRMVEQGRPCLLAVLQDATALKTLEAQFVQSQKMQAIGQLAGGIAHDFNNLLTAISGHCDLLLLRHSATDPDFADLVQIHQNANRAAGLVAQLLAFSRKQTLQPQRLDLEEVLSELIHLLNRLVGERVRLALTQAQGLGAIRADRRQLEQVLMNLVVNARDAMPDGGTIRIETAALALAEPLARGRAVIPAGDYAVIRVIDSGVGIPADRLDKIFEPFFTTKGVGEGTGLGLSTVYGIVKQSGGFVFVESEPGRGSTFEVCFPVFEPQADAPATTGQTGAAVSPSPALIAGAASDGAPDGAVDGSRAAGAADGIGGATLDGPGAVTGWATGAGPTAAGGGQAAGAAPGPAAALPAAAGHSSRMLRPGQGVVLLVEDEAPVRAFAARALRLRGYTVIEAENAEEALAALADPGLEVDVFVTDVVMPGMDGPAWVREALRGRPGVRVVFVSGYAEDALGEDGPRIPGAVFLPKPFSLNDLAATVQGQIVH
jgi:two-component system cell cycle sensor histidine kinase/response regulator CckA